MFEEHGEGVRGMCWLWRTPDASLEHRPFLHLFPRFFKRRRRRRDRLEQVEDGPWPLEVDAHCRVVQ